MLKIKEKAINGLPHGFFIPMKPKVLTQLQRLMRDNESIISDFAKVITTLLSGEILIHTLGSKEFSTIPAATNRSL